MKAFPTGMELFPSADDEQFEFIRREIESSDYYVVIIAGKYGSLAADGSSFTEKEYDYAIEIGKPVMAFVFHDVGELKGTQLETNSDARAKVEAFRKKVAKGKLVKFFKNPDELKSQVLQALMHAFNLKPGQGWVRAQNARRIEDLQEITRLQKQVMELDAENAALKAFARDPREQLAKGADVRHWTVHVTVERSVGLKKTEYKFGASWDELLIACFSIDFPDASVVTVAHGIERLIVAKYNDAGKGKAKAQWADSQATLADIKRQLLGLGYINARLREHDELWTLTDEGKIRLALLRGATRRAHAGTG